MSMAALILVACLGVMAASPAAAFDHQRKGFLLGYSLGPGYHSLRFSDSQSENFNAAGVAGTLRIGWGLSENTELYLFNAGITSLRFYFIPIPYTSSVTGLGIRQYVFKGLYLGGGGGFGSLNLAPKGIGPGGMVDVGWEFAKHWTLGIQVTAAGVKPVEPYDSLGGDIKRAGSASLQCSGTIF